MFYEELENIYEIEKQNDVNTITDLSRFLVDTYHKEKGGKLYKKDLIIKALTNVLGNLFIKYQTKEYINRTIKEEYDKDYKPQLYFPMNNSLYAKNNYDVENYKYVTHNIKMFGLTSKNKNHIISILKLFNICEVSIGEYQKNTTILTLKNYMEWRNDIFKKSINRNLRIYHAFARDYLYELNNPSKNRKLVPNTYVKQNGIRMEVEKDLIDKTNQINELWPKELKRFYYTRVFSENVYNGGRLYSLFNQIPKKERKMLILDYFDYKEIDFTAFVPNTMKIFVDGESFKERPYNKVSREIIKGKFKKKDDKERRNKALIIYEQVIADQIKRPILMMMNQEGYAEQDIMKNKAVWNSLVESGLANTKEELRKAKYHSGNKIEDAKRRNKELYTYRAMRWNENVDSKVECPHFFIKPNNLLVATKKALKEIDKFLLTSNWGWTQYIESELLLRVSLDLKEDNLLPLFIHDAFIVPEKYYQKYRELSERYVLEIVDDYRKMILTEEIIIEIGKKLDSLLRKSNQIEYLMKEYNKGTLERSEIKTITMKTIKYMKEELNLFMKRDMNKFYYSMKVYNYWSLYWIVRETIEERLKPSE